MGKVEFDGREKIELRTTILGFRWHDSADVDRVTL